MIRVHILRNINSSSSVGSEPHSENLFQCSFHGVFFSFSHSCIFFSILSDFGLGCSDISSSAISSPCPNFSPSLACNASQWVCLSCVPYRIEASPPFPSAVILNCNHSVESLTSQLRVHFRTGSSELQGMKSRQLVLRNNGLLENHTSCHTLVFVFALLS